MRTTMRNRLLSILLLLATCCVIILVSECIFRVRYRHYFYSADDQVKAIQSHLVLHPKLGFTWKANIKPTGIILRDEDAELDPLCSDKNGFLNHPEAINTSETVDVIGLGDSFMEHAHYEFYGLFRENGLNYYSMSVHRQCPAQYNIILRDYALKEKPKWIIYGLYENDFLELDDFEDWQESGLDWFSFHSGTWCGRSLNTSSTERFFKKHFRGFFALEKVLREKLNLQKDQSDTISSEKVARCINEAHGLAAKSNVKMLLVLIPSKETALNGPTVESALFDEVLKQLKKPGPEVIDLRASFAEVENPSDLFYKLDGHWNRKGMRKAGELVLNKILNE